MRLLPHLQVYKTKADYNNRVPVVLSDNKMKVVSFPDPADLRAGSPGWLPALLHKRYLLSKYGISKNTAFLKLTFDEYAALPSAPSAEELYKMILDKNPIKELCDCGVAKRGTDTEKELNALIDKGLLRKKCKVIK